SAYCLLPSFSMAARLLLLRRNLLGRDERPAAADLCGVAVGLRALDRVEAVEDLLADTLGRAVLGDRRRLLAVARVGRVPEGAQDPALLGGRGGRRRSRREGEAERHDGESDAAAARHGRSPRLFFGSRRRPRMARSTSRSGTKRRAGIPSFAMAVTV